jgi:hypothetical protein
MTAGNVFNISQNSSNYFPKLQNAYGVGFNTTGGYAGTKNGEKFYFNAFVTAYNSVLGLPAPRRITGRTCSGDVFTFNDTIMLNLLSKVNDFKNFLINLKNILFLSDTETTRKSDTTQHLNVINSTIDGINNWLALDSYYFPNPPTCADYNLITDANTKYSTSNLLNLNSLITNKRNYSVNTRISQINSYLGEISQDTTNGYFLDDGNLGLYGGRAYSINGRINSKTGTLTRIKELRGKIVVENNMLRSYYASLSAVYARLESLNPSNTNLPPLIYVSPIFYRNGNYTNVIAKSAQYFNVNDVVFVVGGVTGLGGDFDYIASKIIRKQGSIIYLDKTIPQIYTIEKYGYPRIYKITSQ